MKKKILCIILALTLIAPVIKVQAKAKPSLNHKTIYMSTADKVKLKVLNNRKKVKWTSSNKKVARVSKNGTVTPRWFGKTTITANFGKKKLRCKVYVKEEEVWFDDAGHEVSVMPTSKRKARIKIRIGKDKFTKTVKKTANYYKIKKKGKSGRYYDKLIYARGMYSLIAKKNEKKIYYEFYCKIENS